MNSRLERVAIAAILCFAAMLALVGIDYYLPRHYDPAPDSIHPAVALDAFEHVFGERSVAGLKYPRLHLVASGAVERCWLALTNDRGAEVASELVALLRAPPDGSGMLGWRDRFRPYRDVLSELILVGRALSTLAFVALVLGVFHLARQLLAPAAALLAAFFVTLSYPLVYYAHTLNVDVPYLALAIWALAIACRAARERCGRRLVLAAFLAALAIATKDQAYGIFVLTIPFVIVRWMRGERGEPAAFPWRPTCAALGVSAVCYALALGLPFDVAGVRAHFAHIVGAGSEAYQLYPKSINGQFDLAHEVVLHLRDALGWPLLVLALPGLVALHHTRRAACWWLVIPIVSYHLTFLAPIRYCYQRFTLPISILLAIAAAAAFGWMFERRRLRVAGILIAIVLAGDRAQRAIEVDTLLLADPRAPAAEFLASNVAEGETIAAALELPLSNVELPAGAVVRLLPPGAPPVLAPGESAPAIVVFAPFDPQRTAYVRSPSPVELPLTARAFGVDYDRIAHFAPVMAHPVRHGAAFQPTIGIYRIRR